jgi:hypothetical protein
MRQISISADGDHVAALFAARSAGGDELWIAEHRTHVTTTPAPAGFSTTTHAPWNRHGQHRPLASPKPTEPAVSGLTSAACRYPKVSAKQSNWLLEAPVSTGRLRSIPSHSRRIIGNRRERSTTPLSRWSRSAAARRPIDRSPLSATTSTDGAARIRPEHNINLPDNEPQLGVF